MLKSKSNGNTITSSDGWSVNLEAPFYVTYSDRRVRVKFGIERLVGEFDFEIFPSTAAYGFFSRKNLPPAEMDTVLGKIIDALAHSPDQGKGGLERNPLKWPPLFG